MLNHLGLLKAENLFFKFCENKPEIVVNREFQYLWALKRLGLKYKHETFDDRNTVESFFSKFKENSEQISIQKFF